MFTWFAKTAKLPYATVNARSEGVRADALVGHVHEGRKMKVSFLGAGLLVALTGCVNVPGLGNSRYLHITNGDKTLIYSQIAFTKRERCLARKHATDQAVAQGRAWLNGGSYLCSDFDMGAKVFPQRAVLRDESTGEQVTVSAKLATMCKTVVDALTKSQPDGRPQFTEISHCISTPELP